jgi:hypothetical protein
LELKVNQLLLELKVNQPLLEFKVNQPLLELKVNQPLLESKVNQPLLEVNLPVILSSFSWKKKKDLVELKTTGSFFVFSSPTSLKSRK